jgi:hypothetical protein
MTGDDISYDVPHPSDPDWPESVDAELDDIAQMIHALAQASTGWRPKS